ncbi:MAG: hypothetical protein J4F32_06990, partial [Dehalococcoidia bacterium]|nr:hypothetical protein [Dehalococcoidia bacterium]
MHAANPRSKRPASHSLRAGRNPDYGEVPEVKTARLRWFKNGLALALAALALTAAAACSDGGEATPTPTTAPVPSTLPTPTPAAVPEPAATPTPQPPLAPVDFTTWRNQDLGASLRHPSAWEQVDSEDPNAWAMFSDPGAGASLTLLVEFVALDIPLQDRLDAAVNRETPAGVDDVNVVRYGAASLADGTEAMRADIVFARGQDTYVSRVQVAQRGALTITLLLHGPQALFDRQAGPFAATLDSLSVFPPSPYGVSRESAFIMPL